MTNANYKSAYSKKLLDPRWQKKRLEIMQRDDWMCQLCGDKENTLHVHHVFYLKDKDIWDYPECLLITLCDSCHEEEHSNAYDDAISILKQLRKNGILYTDIRNMLEESLIYSDSRDQFSNFYMSLTDQLVEKAKK